MTGITTHGEKRLVLASGRAHPDLAQEIAKELGIDLLPMDAYDFANGEIYVRFGESVRGSDAFVIQSHPAPHQQVAHGAADHGRCAQAGLRQADHGGRAVLPLRPAGQEAPRPRADLRAAHRRPVQDGRRRPPDDRRPAHRADPGLLRRAGGPPVGPAAARGLRPHRASTAPGSRSSRRTPAASGSPTCGPTGSGRRWRSSTSAATRPCRTRQVHEVVGEVAGRTCRARRRHDRHRRDHRRGGARRCGRTAPPRCIVAATHAVLSEPAVDRLKNSPITRGGRHQHAADRPRARRFPQLTVLSIAPLIARAIREVFDDGSVTSLFDGNA